MSEPPTPTESELVEFVRAIDVPAPPGLHARIERLVAEHSAGGRSGTPRALLRAPALAWLGGAVALAAVAVLLAVGLAGGGSPSAPDVRAASALTLRPATLGAPAESPRHRAEVAAQVDGVAFPYWEESLGWRTVGARSDRIGGRTVGTVFYADAHGRRIGYAIVGGAPPRLSGGTVLWHGGTAYHLLTVAGRPVVAWLRSGRLCIISGTGVDSATLLHLASWDARGGTAT